MEYTQDRLRHEIKQLQKEIEDLKSQTREYEKMTLIAEVILCIVAFVAGFFVTRIFI